MQNLRRVGKNAGRAVSRLWTKVHAILGRRRRPLVVVNALIRLSISVSFRSYKPLKLPLSCELDPKRWFLGPRFLGEGIAQISDMRFQTTLTSIHVADFGSVRFSEFGD